MVYVQNMLGQPLMPTEDHRLVRILLKQGKAKVVRGVPFTIRLTVRVKTYVQPVTLGVDAGSKTIGLSATTEKKELIAAEAKPRNDVVKLLSDRRELRSSRRNRTTRYRQARFNNRVHSKPKNWIAPSVQVKVNNHVKAVAIICTMLPVTTIRVENAEFDIQRLKAVEAGAPLPVGTDYQLGEMYDQYNVRQYVLYRDGYQCTCCGAPKKGSKSQKLHVHHLESRKTGSNRPDNLITLCDVCHKLYHEGKITLKKTKPKSYRDAAFMGIMRKYLTNKLKELYPNIEVCETYGYITKYNRDKYHIEKSHINDGYAIAKNFKAKRANEYFVIEFKRRHNRKIHKNTVNKGGARKLNAQSHTVKGYRLFDRVKYKNKYYFVFGRRSSGYFDIRDLNGNKVNKGSINAKLLKIVDFAKTILIERRKDAPPMTKVTGLRA